jgi:hypothetical protein
MFQVVEVVDSIRLQKCLKIGNNLQAQYDYMSAQYLRCPASLVELDSSKGIMKIEGSSTEGYVLQQVGASCSTVGNLGVMASLVSLHTHGVVHGDPRFPNVLLFDGVLKWFDLAPNAADLTIAHDLAVFVACVLHRSTVDINQSSQPFLLYCETPSVETLIEVIAENALTPHLSEILALGEAFESLPVKGVGK